MLLIRRLWIVVGMFVVLLAGTAGTASAHTVGGSGASDYRTRLLSFNAPAGVTLSVAENGNKLLLTNTTSTPLTVLGYEGEPYLLVTSTGVRENQRSTATFLNVDRYLTAVVIPPTADNQGTDYTSISGKPIAIWHDHRIHWMATTLPPAVAAAPSRYHVIQTWRVNFRYGNTPLVATGELDWVPGPSPYPSALLALATLVLAAGLSLRSRRYLGLGLLLLTLADIVHTLGVAGDRAGVGIAAGLYAYPVVDAFWLLALVGATLLLAGRRRRLALAATAVSSAWMLLVGGLSDVATFKDTTAPFIWSIELERVLTAIELGTGIAVLAVAVRGLLTVGGGRVRRDDNFEDDDWDYERGTYGVASSG